MLQVQEGATRYIRAYSVGEILRTTLQIYFRHFGVLFSIPIIALIVASVGLIALVYLGFAIGIKFFTAIIAGIGYIGFYFLLFAAGAAQTAAISEITLGHRPNLVRAYRRVLGATTGKVFITALMLGLLLFVGTILFVVPALVFMVWYLLAAPVVVLENRWGRDALRRSRQLGKGFYGRLIGIYSVAIVAFGPLLTAAAASEEAAPVVALLVFALLFTLLPALSVLFVLMYYDLRVRKEGYDLAALSEDLSH